MKNYLFGFAIGIIAVLMVVSFSKPNRVLAEGDMVRGEKSEGPSYQWEAPYLDEVILESGDKVRGEEGVGPTYQLGECPFIG